MNRRKALTLVEFLVLLAILAIAIAFLIYAMTRSRSEARLIRCRNNLNGLGKGMWTYMNEHGDDRFLAWPTGRAGCGGTQSAEAADFGGAEWLASLYWVRILPDTGVFICPNSGDSNADGRNLGDRGCRGPGFQAGPDGKLKLDAVSYAGIGSTSVAVYERVKLKRPGLVTKSAVRDDFSQNEPIACDDTEGTINHPSGLWRSGGMNVLFFDTRLEFWPADRVDLEHGVGEGELVHLRN